MKLEIRLSEDQEYYHTLEAWYPHIFWELEGLRGGKVSRTLSIHFGRLTLNAEWPVLNPFKYSYNNYEEMQALKEKHDVYWWFGDVVDKWTGRDRAAEAEARYQELLGSAESDAKRVQFLSE